MHKFLTGEQIYRCTLLQAHKFTAAHCYWSTNPLQEHKFKKILVLHLTIFCAPVRDLCSCNTLLQALPYESMGAPVTKCAPVRNLDNQVWYHNTDNQGEGLCNQGEVFPISCFKWKNPGEGFKLKKKTQGGFCSRGGFFQLLHWDFQLFLCPLCTLITVTLVQYV